MWLQFVEAMDSGNIELAKKIFKELRGDEKIRAKKWLFGANAKNNKKKKSRKVQRDRFDEFDEMENF